MSFMPWVLARWLGYPTVIMLLPLAARGQSPIDPQQGVEEFVVTARKVPEALSRVPASIQAVSGEFLDRRNLSSPYDMQFEVPGLVLNNRGMFGAGLALRGVTDEGGGTLAIAPHINGVYLGRSNAAVARQFDVERVEVVKGPQGTLYGRNATGGSINVVTRAPADELEAQFTVSAGSFDTATARAEVNVPGETIAARFAFAGADGDGFIRNSVDDRRFAAEDYTAQRASLRTRPTAALRVDVMAQRVDDDGASGELWLPRKDRLPDPNDIHLTTVTLDDPHLFATNDFVGVDATYELDRLTLRSITGYARNETDALDDCAGIAQLQGCVRGVRPLRYEQRSQELRLQSSVEEPLRWLLGVFYFEADELQRFHFLVPGIAPVPVNDYTATSAETSYAVFGDVTRALGDRWRVSGGLRLSRDEDRSARVGTGTADAASAAASGSWEDASWRVGFELDAAEGLLLYANVSTGFKSGGSTTELLPNGEFDSYAPERLLSYEAGVTFALPGRRSTLRASAFDYDFEDMQVRTIAVLENRVTSVIDNAAAARIRGLDVAAATQISGRVSLSGGLVWLPTREFVEFVTASGASLAGNDVSMAPEWSASVSVGYRAPLAGRGELSAELDLAYRSEFYFTKENDAIARQDSFGLVNLLVRFDSLTAGWHVFAAVRNLLGTDYFNQALIQSAPGQPRRYEVGFGWRH